MSSLTVAGVRCSSCGRMFVAPQYACPACGADAFETVALGDTGCIYSLTTIHVAPEGLEDQAPYQLGLIEMTGGLRLTARIRSSATQAQIGNRVELIEQDDHGYLFRIVAEST